MPGRKILFKRARTRSGFNWFLKRKRAMTGKPLTELADKAMDVGQAALSVKQVGKTRKYLAKYYSSINEKMERKQLAHHEHSHVRQLIFHFEHGFPLRTNSALAYIEEFIFTPLKDNLFDKQAFDKRREKILKIINNSKQIDPKVPKNLEEFKLKIQNGGKPITLGIIGDFVNYLYVEFNNPQQLFKEFTVMLKDENMRRELEQLNNVTDSQLERPEISRKACSASVQIIEFLEKRRLK